MTEEEWANAQPLIEKVRLLVDDLTKPTFMFRMNFSRSYWRALFGGTDAQFWSRRRLLVRACDDIDRILRAYGKKEDA